MGLFDGFASSIAGKSANTLNPTPGAANQNNKGLMGLGGPSSGLFNKFGSMLNGMFGGSGGSAPSVPKYADGGGVAPPTPQTPGGDNPYAAQVTMLDQQIEAAKNSIVQGVPKEQWQTAMEETVMPLMEERQRLATLSAEWSANNQSTTTGGTQQQQPTMTVNPNPGQGMEATDNSKSFGPGTNTAGQAKARKITIEEK